MKKLLLSLLFLATVNVFATEEPRYFSVTNFGGGLNSNYSSLTIADDEVQDALNVFFDADNSVVKRNGFATYGTTGTFAFTNGWTYTDSSNNNWIVVLSSDAIRASDGDGTFSIVIATVPTPTESLVGAVNAEGRIYFVDQIQGVYYWAGSGTATKVSGSPLGSLITEYKGRVWVSGEAQPNQNRLSASKYLDGTTWTTGTLATDPITYIVGLNDRSDGITSMFSGLNDAIYLTKNKSIYALFGFDQTDFQVSVITSESGCLDQGSVQPYANGLVCVSQRGLEYFDGVNISLISKKIRNKIASALSSNFSQRSWTLTSKADWDSGTISTTSWLSTSITEGSIMLSTMAVIVSSDDTQANFQDGTLTNLSATTSSGSIQLSLTAAVAKNSSTPSDNPNLGACDPSYYAFTQSFTPTTSYIATSVAIKVRRQGSPGDYRLDLKSDNSTTPGTTISSAAVATSGITTDAAGEVLTYTLVPPIRLVNGTRYWLQFVPLGTCNPSTPNIIRTVEAFQFDSTGEYYARGSGSLPHDVSLGYYTYYVVSGSTYSGTGDIVSQTFDIGVTTTDWLWNWGSLTTTKDIPTGSTITYQTQTSSDGITFDSLVPVADSGITTSTVRRYIRYKASFSTVDGSVTPTLNDVTINAGPFRRPSGSFLSPSFNIGANITSFGTFDPAADLTTGGSILYYICSSSMSTMVPSTCAAQTAFGQITVPPNTYVQFASSFSITVATYNPIIAATVVKWNEGTRRPRMTSAIYDDRYWVSMTTNSLNTANDATIVLAKSLLDNKFILSMFDIHAGAYILFKGELYHADSEPTGKVYKDNQGFNDNGSAITAYIVTKDYAPDGLITEKIFDKLRLFSDSLGNYTVETSYYLDSILTNEFDLSTVTTNETDGRINIDLPFPYDATHQKMGYSIVFKFGNSTVDAPMRVYGGNLTYKARPIQ